MPRSKRPARSGRDWEQHTLSLAWGAWSELGVAGWGETHASWAIDPEALIFFTAGLGDRDPRLRDEAADWCIRNWRFISRVRLRNLMRKQPDAVPAAYGEFAATVNDHAGMSWPGATRAWRGFRVSGRSTLRPLQRPSLICLRTRAMFGVSARAEILRLMVTHPGRGLSVARLAKLAGYAKRNVAEECETLELAGLLTRRTVGNRFLYAPARPADLRAFIGDLPDVSPDWGALTPVVLAFLALADAEAELSPEAFTVEVHRSLHELRDDLDELDFDVPTTQLKGAALWPAAKAWADDLLTALGAGDWPGSEPAEDYVPLPGRVVRRRA